jgi:Zn-dependent M28 family amino/carboxypeptidase
VTSSRLSARVAAIRNKGAAAVFSILSPEREAKGFKTFEKLPAGRMGTLYDSQRTSFGPPAARTTTPAARTTPQAVSPASQVPPTSQASQTTQTAPAIPPRPSLPFAQADISHELAADILGVSIAEVGAMFVMLKEGKQVPSKNIPEVRVQLDVKTESYPSTSRSVIGVVEGTDPVLKNEYIVVSGHHDHLGISNGEVIAGADDNATATVALIEIAQALLVERPKRSVIIAWFTGEEKGLNGSHYFVNNCPVPVEKISTCLNMDMLGRNNVDSLFLVGSDLISSELDGAINKVNKQFKINFGFSYVYSNLTHPSSVYTRSDHYPFIRFGIPSVWFFCGFTPDYHTPKDVLEFIDYKKFFKITKLVYLTAFETANKKELLKLDVNPAVTSRGKHNLTERSLFRAPAR